MAKLSAGALWRPDIEHWIGRFRAICWFNDNDNTSRRRSLIDDAGWVGIWFIRVASTFIARQARPDGQVVVVYHPEVIEWLHS